MSQFANMTVEQVKEFLLTQNHALANELAVPFAILLMSLALGSGLGYIGIKNTYGGALVGLGITGIIMYFILPFLITLGV